MPPVRLSSFTAALARWRAGIVDEVASRFTNVTGIGGPDARGTFAVGSAAPLVTVALGPETALLPVVGGTSLVLLGALGWLAAQVGGARPWAGAARVVLWGALAMAVTAAVGALFGTTV